MKRITEAFENAKAQGRGAFVAYLTIGYPSLAKCEAAIDTLVSEGADIIDAKVNLSLESDALKAWADQVLGASMENLESWAEEIDKADPEI